MKNVFPQKKDVDKVLEPVFAGARRATVYVSPEFVIKAVRTFRVEDCKRITTVVLTYGRPNYAERNFIAACKKAGEPFPVKKAQVRLK